VEVVELRVRRGEGAAAEGRRFGRRRRSSESESDEAVEGNAPAAAAIG